MGHEQLGMLGLIRAIPLMVDEDTIVRSAHVLAAIHTDPDYQHLVTLDVYRYLSTEGASRTLDTPIEVQIKKVMIEAIQETSWTACCNDQGFFPIHQDGKCPNGVVDQPSEENEEPVEIDETEVLSCWQKLKRHYKKLWNGET